MEPTTLETLNSMKPEAARETLLRCCGSTRWAEHMAEARPFLSPSALLAAAERMWPAMTRADWLEAFGGHPRIGDIDSLRAKFASTEAWAKSEQSGARNASEETLKALAEGNRRYEEKFGTIFIVCATGKSASEMLSLLESRIGNDPADEIGIAAEEQQKITRIRLRKLTAMSAITTHVLDTARGVPAAGLAVTLEFLAEGESWQMIGTGSTDANGRLQSLCPPDRTILPGDYRITFDTAAYFKALGTASFYPTVVVTFTLPDPSQHYHIPLLLSPYGYSTYRGS